MDARRRAMAEVHTLRPQPGPQEMFLIACGCGRGVKVGAFQPRDEYLQRKVILGLVAYLAARNAVLGRVAQGAIYPVNAVGDNGSVNIWMRALSRGISTVVAWAGAQSFKGFEIERKDKVSSFGVNTRLGVKAFHFAKNGRAPFWAAAAGAKRLRSCYRLGGALNLVATVAFHAPYRIPVFVFCTCWRNADQFTASVSGIISFGKLPRVRHV